MMRSTNHPGDASAKVLFDPKVMRRTLSWQSGGRVPVDPVAPPETSSLPVSQGVICVTSGTHSLLQVDVTASPDSVRVAIGEGELVVWRPGSMGSPISGFRIPLAASVAAERATATIGYGVLTVRLTARSLS